MRIKLLTSLAGNGWNRNAGDVYDSEGAEAVALIAAGFAQPVRVEPAVETADLPGDQETASVQPAAPKPRRRNVSR